MLPTHNDQAKRIFLGFGQNSQQGYVTDNILSQFGNKYRHNSYFFPSLFCIK